MPNLDVGVFGVLGYSCELGKKGTESDITFYNLKRGETTLTLLEPTRYPEKLASLFYASSFSDTAVLVVDSRDAALGETILMLHRAGPSKGIIVTRNYIAEEQVAQLTRGTKLEKYVYSRDDAAELREHLLDEAEATRSGSDGPGAVTVDHAFNVRGVGTVALGVVKEGTVRKHDDLSVLPPALQAELRSIQKHDDDFDSTSTGDRVDFSLRNVDAKDLERGAVLTTDASIRATSTVKGRAEIVPYWRAPLNEGMPLHLGHWMQFVSARIQSIEDSGDARRPTLTVSLGRPLVHPPGSAATMTYLDDGKLRVVGKIRLQ